MCLNVIGIRQGSPTVEIMASKHGNTIWSFDRLDPLKPFDHVSTEYLSLNGDDDCYF